MQGFPPDINFKVLGDEMARKRFGFENEDLELEKLPDNFLNKFNNNSKIINKDIIKNTNTNINLKINKKLNKNDSDSKMYQINLGTNRYKKKNQEMSKNDNSETGKINQDGNSNIINTNTNINTNLNTATNINSYLNTNINNNINTNNNDIDNNNPNENDLYSDKNSQMNENSSISNNNKNENDNEKDNDNEPIINQIIKQDNDVTVEIVNPAYLKKMYDNNFDDDININVNTKLNINNNKIKKSKIKKSTLYEREMKNRKRINDKLNKKREIKIKKEEKLLKEGPEIDPISQSIIETKEIYIPIDKRAANIHSMKISQRILYEENNKILKQKEEEEEIQKYKKNQQNKKYDKDEWNEFVERQYQWKDEVEYKRKAADILRNNVDKKTLFKPKINNKSKSIIKDIQSGNESFIDEVFIRLFNDFEEHKERQKFRNEQSLPSFKPKISKNSSQKNLNCNLKIPYRSGTTPLMNIKKNDNLKKKYSIASSIKNENKNCNKAKSEKLFSDIFNNNIEKYLNTNKSGNIKQIINKSQGATQLTNISHINANNSDINTDLINSKYIFLDKPLNNENIIKNNQNQKKPFLPSNIRKMIEQNCNEEEEEDENNNISQNNKSIKNNLNYNTNGISEESNYNEENSNLKENYMDNNKFKETEEEDENFFNVENEQSEREGTNRKLLNINNNKDIKDMNIIEKINEVEKTRKFYGQNQNETINSEDSKLTENNLYKLNIRNTTPFVVKQDIILASKDFSDFFDVPEMDEDF